MLRPLILALSVCVATLAGGCAVNRATATADPALRWNDIRTMHVKKLEGDDAGLHLVIAKKFSASGFAVTADPAAPAKPDAVVTYVDHWMWDITMYMIELTVTVRDAKSDLPLATGNSYHTSLSRKSPQEMVDEVVDNILKTRK